MSGLRAKQKAERERRILDAATVLFRDLGYENTKIETIAEQAGIAIGTIYNYFQSKGDLLLAIVSVEVNEVLNAGSRLLASPGEDVEHTINALFGIYLEHSLVYLDKGMWRNAMAMTTRAPDSPFGLHYRGLDKQLATQACELVCVLQRAGRVRPDVDDRAVGEMLFNNMNMMFVNFVQAEDMSLTDLKARIERQNKPLANAIAL